MAVIVKRYRVRHDGKVYGPGDVITGLSKKEEARLISESNGTIELYKAVKTEEKNDEKVVVESAEDDDDEPGIDEIASLNADELIKPAK